MGLVNQTDVLLEAIAPETLSKEACLLLEAAMFVEKDTFYERVEFTGLFNKLNIPKQHGKGILQVLAKSGRALTDVVWLAMKSSLGDKKAKEELKALLKTEIKREDVKDFLLRLDTVTLSIVSTPVRVIDALTGWDLWGKIVKGKTTTIDTIKKAITELEGAADKLTGDLQKQLKKHIATIRELIPA